MLGITHNPVPVAQALHAGRGRHTKVLATMVAVVAAFAVVAVLALASGDGPSAPPSTAVSQPALEQSILPPGVRYDGGPDEGRSLGSFQSQQRYDGGPEEGSASISGR